MRITSSLYRFLSLRLIFVSSLLLVACGGGGGGGSNSYSNNYGYKSFPALGVAELIETNNNSVLDLNAAIDSNGNVLAVWRQSDGTHFSIWSNRYSATNKTWGTARLIETNAAEAYLPHVGFDASGNAFATWYQFDGTSYSVWANRFTLSTLSWGAAVTLGSGSSSPKIAFDASGNAFAIWDKSGDIVVSRYTASTASWSVAATIKSAAAVASYPQIAVDFNGNALAVWCQLSGSRYAIWANRYSAISSSWGAASIIDSGAGNANNFSYDENPRIVIDASGNGMAVWNQTKDTRNAIWANRYINSTSSWAIAVVIDATDESAAPQVSVDANGNALAVWYQTYGPINLKHIITQANRYTVSTSSWGLPVTIGPMEGVAREPKVAMNSNGNAWVVWVQHGGDSFPTSNVMAKSYSVSTSTWGGTSFLETLSSYPSSPQIAINGNGSAFALWEQTSGGFQSAWANRIQ